MAGVTVEAGSALAQAIQGVVQPKLIENGWVAEENDTTLSEYVTMMVVNKLDLQGVTSELGGDLLGMGEDDPAVGEFAVWLFEQVRALAAPAQQETNDHVEMQQAEQEAQPIPTVQDSPMDEAAAPVDGVPIGPKAMRNGAGRGRDKRMLGQLNSHLNRNDSLPDPLRRIKGAAGGQQGRINSHAGRDPPRGPKSNLATGVQRVMNGGGRGGHHGGPMAQNPMTQQAGMMNQLNPQHQMAFMQMMEMQANMMSQMVQNGQMPNFGQQNEGSPSLFDRVDKRQRGGFKGRQQHRTADSQNGDAASGDMEVDKKGEPFETMCRFNTSCTNATCPFAHQSPAAPPGQTVDMTDICSFGAACENKKCSGRHPSPAQRTQHLKQEVDCKFFPNCTNANCPFRHPDMPLCRNGADCNVVGCKFTHSKISCRYNPCTKPFCSFKHAEGQRGVYKDKVWTAGDGVPDLDGETNANDVANRFSELKDSENSPEELILPGQQQDSQGSQMQPETQITI